MNATGMTKTAVLVGGTWSWRGWTTTGEWYQAGSPFVTFLEAQGVQVLSKDRPFVWESAVDVFKGKTQTWEAAGAHLYDYLVPPLGGPDRDNYVPIPQRNIIAHSHGLQVVLEACRGGLRINNLVSVCSPVRDDYLALAQTLKQTKAIQGWLHLTGSSWKDRMIWMGGLFDGHWGIRRTHPSADQNDGNGKADHGSFVRDPAFFPDWVDRGWLAYTYGSIPKGAA